MATLGGGVSVSLYDDGLRISRGNDLLLQSVIGGAFLSAVEGTVSGSGKDTEESVEHALSNVEVDELVFLPGRATYFGSAHGDGRRLPFTMRVELAGSTLRVAAAVNGADAVVFHLDHVPDTVGIRPSLKEVNLRGRADLDQPQCSGGPGRLPHDAGHRCRCRAAAGAPRGRRPPHGSHRRPRVERRRIPHRLLAGPAPAQRRMSAAGLVADSRHAVLRTHRARPDAQRAHLAAGAAGHR